MYCTTGRTCELRVLFHMLVMIHVTNVFLLLLIFINRFHAFDAHYIHCTCCNVMRSCLTVTHGLLHAQAMTRARFLEYKSATKFPLIVPKRERSPYSKIDVYKTAENTCTIRRLKRNFCRFYKLRKWSSEACDPSHTWASFRRVIRHARAIARLSLTSLAQQSYLNLCISRRIELSSWGKNDIHVHVNNHIDVHVCILVTAVLMSYSYLDLVLAYFNS